MRQGDHRPECCRKAENLYVAETKHTPDGKLVTRKCSICGRRHFEAQANPKSIGVTGA